MNRIANLPNLPLPPEQVKLGFSSLVDALLANDEKRLDLADRTTTGDADSNRNYLDELYGSMMEEMEREAEKDAVATFQNEPAISAAAEVQAFFDNNPECPGLFIQTSDQQYAALDELGGHLAPHGNFITVAMTEDLVPPWQSIINGSQEADDRKRLTAMNAAVAKVRKAAPALAALRRRGVLMHVFAPLPDATPEVVSTAVSALEGAEMSLLGTADGYDHIMPILGDCIDPEADPTLATGRVPMGAILARRDVVDLTKHVGKSLMGNQGAEIGVVQAGVIRDPWPLRDRDNMSMNAINTFRRMSGIGDIVIDGDRSLLAEDGEGVYLYASRARFRSWIISIFFRTVDFYLYGDTGGPEQLVSQAILAMNGFLNDLVEKGWIRSGSVNQTGDSNELELDVKLGMNPTRDRIKLSFSELKNGK